MSLPNRTGAEASTAPTESTSTATSDLGSASFNSPTTSETQSLSNRAVLEEGALKANPDLIDATRKEQTVPQPHHHQSISEAFTKEHHTLQNAGFEGPPIGVNASIATSPAAVATGTQSNAQLHEHILSLALTGSKKKKEAVTDDAELAEFIRQHPELSQYIKELQQARNESLKSALEGKQTGLESASNLDAKLDVIATLLEGSPLAPQLRMGDVVAKDAFIKASKQAFEDADEGVALAEHVWERAREKIILSDQKQKELLALGQNQLKGLVDANDFARVAQIMQASPTEAPQAVREFRNNLESRGIDLHQALDLTTPQGLAFQHLIEKGSPNSELTTSLKTLLFAAQLRAESVDSSTKLPSEKMVDRFLAMSPQEKKLVDSYFQAISQKSTERFLLEAYMGIRPYTREKGSTVLEREPTENREAIVAKLVLNRAAADGSHYTFKNGVALDDGLFRRTVEKIFDVDLGRSKGIREFTAKIEGGIPALDNFDYHLRMHAASNEVASLTNTPAGLKGEALAAHRAEILANILPVALSTDKHSKINLTPQLITALESIPAHERNDVASAYQRLTGSSLEQSFRAYASAPLAEAALNSISLLLASSATDTQARLASKEVQDGATKMTSALQSKDSTELVSSAKSLHTALSAQGISVNRALDVSLDEGKAFDAYLKEQLKDDSLVRQAKAALFAVELEQQAAPSSLNLPSQGMIGYYLGLPKDEKAIVESYFKGAGSGSAERYLFEAFSDVEQFQPLDWNLADKRAARPDSKQIVVALLVSSAEQRGAPMQLKDGQLVDPQSAANEIKAMYADAQKERVDYILTSKLPQLAQADELSTLCRQALLVQNLQALSNGASESDPAAVDKKNVSILVANLPHMLAAEPSTGGNLAKPLLSFISELPEDRRASLREEYLKQTGRELLADIRSGMKAHDPAQADFVTGMAAIALGRDEYERSAGFIAQSVTSTGKLTPQTFADIMRGLDADGCLNGDAQSIDRLNKTVAAYERVSGESLDKLLERNQIPASLIEAVRTGDKATIDAFNLRATMRGSENPIQDMHQLLGGSFNLNSRPELAAAYEKTFGEKFGDVREEVILAAAKEYREDVEARRKTIDSLSKSSSQDREELEKHDFNWKDGAKSLVPVYGIYNAGTKFFYIWDGAYEAQANDMARRAEENLKLTEVYAEKAMRLKEVTAWTDQASDLLKQCQDLEARGESEQAALLDREATILFTKAQCRMMDVPFPTESLEARIQNAQSLAIQHAELLKSGAPAAEVENIQAQARQAFKELVTGPWGPHQTELVRECIQSTLEIDPSLDPRKYASAEVWTRRISNSEGTGYLDEIPAKALMLTEEEREQLDEMKLAGPLREQQERAIVEQKRAEFEIRAEFQRNHMLPMGQRNLALLNLEERFTHRRNMAEFQREWAQVMNNFDRTEGQLKAARTGVLVVGTIFTGGAGLPYMLAITAGSHGVQAVGDGAVGNKSWGEAGKTFVYEGGKDLLNVGMAGGMATVMRSGQMVSLLGRAGGSQLTAATALGGRTGLVVRQIAVSGVSGSAFGLGMEGTNLAWDVGMHQIKFSQREVSFDEMRTRLLTAGVTGFVGGSIGGSSQMLRSSITGKGIGSSFTRGLISTGEYSVAGASSQFQVGWGPNGSFGVHRQGDIFSAVMAVGSTYAGNKAAQGHAPQTDHSQVRSFALFQPEPGVYSTPGVKNFSVHAAELKPITDRVGSMLGITQKTPAITIEQSALQARSLSKQISDLETALKFGYEITKAPASEGSQLLALPAGGQEAAPTLLTDALTLQAEPAAQKRVFTPEERVQLEARLTELKAEFETGLSKAGVDKNDRAINAKAEEKIAALKSVESETLRLAQEEATRIKAQLKNKGSDAVHGEERQRLENQLRVLNEKTIPIAKEADILAKQHKPNAKNPEEFKLLTSTIEEVAKLEALGKRHGGLADLNDAQHQRLVEGYKVLEDVKYTRTISENLQTTKNGLKQKAGENDWCPERLQAETDVATLKAKLKLLERTTPEGADKGLHRTMLEDQLGAAKRQVGIEREVDLMVNKFGAGTAKEFAAAREFLLARQELLAAGRNGTPELTERFNAADAKQRAVQEAAQTTAAMNAHNAKLEARRAKAETKIDKANQIEPLQSARKEEGKLDTLLKSHRKEVEIVRQAHELTCKEIAAENQRTPRGEDNPRLVELMAQKKKLDLWMESDKGARARNEGEYSQRNVKPQERQTFEQAREIVQNRRDSIRNNEISYLEAVNQHAGGKKYEAYPKVQEAARKVATAERAAGIYVQNDSMIIDGRMSVVPPDPQVTAAHAQLVEAKRLAGTDITLKYRSDRLTQAAEKYKWHSELVAAKQELLERTAEVSRTKNLPKTSEARELAVANKAAAQAKVDLETSVYTRAIKHGFGTEAEIKVARELAIIERDTTFDPLTGMTDNPQFHDKAARLSRLQAATAQRNRDTAHNQKVDNGIAAREAKLEARQELPELKELRKELNTAESAYKRRGNERVSQAADPILTEKINDLRNNKIPLAERTDQLARKNGYSTKPEIEAARAIAALEQKVGTRNPTPDEIRLRLSPGEQAELKAAWSDLQSAQTDSKRLKFETKVNQDTERRRALVNDKPWLEERKAAAREEIRLEGELKKVKGSSPEADNRRIALNDQLQAHRDGVLRDAERLDFLARHRGGGTQAEQTAAKNLIAAERQAERLAGKGYASPAVEDARDILNFERTRVQLRTGLEAQIIKREWIRDYSLQGLCTTVLPPSSALAISNTSISLNAVGAAGTPLAERIATMEDIFARGLNEQEIEFLRAVPDFAYNEIVRRLDAGWMPNSDGPTLPQSGRALEGVVVDRPQLSAASDTPQRALPPAREPVLVVEQEASPITVSKAAEPEAPMRTFPEERKLVEQTARELEHDLLRGRDSRGRSIDADAVRENLIAQKEKLTEIINQEIDVRRKMISLGSEFASKGEMPGGIKADPELIKAGQRELFMEIEALDKSLNQIRAETTNLRQKQIANRNEQRYPSSREYDNSLRNDGDDNWWRTGGSAPEYKPDGGFDRGGGTATSSRGTATATRERVAFSPFESDSPISVLETTNQERTFIASTTEEPIAAVQEQPSRPAPMTEREIDNFMLGVDDLDGSPLDAVFDHIEGTKAKPASSRPAPRSQTRSDPFRSTGNGSRPAVTFQDAEPTLQPQRQTVAEPARVQVAVATETKPFTFNFEQTATSTDTTLAVFSPEVETHMAALSQAVDQIAPTTTTTLAPYRAPTVATPAVQPQVQVQPLTSLSAATGQLLGRLTKQYTGTNLDEDTRTNPKPENKPQPAKAPTKLSTDEEIPTEKKRRRNGEEGEITSEIMVHEAKHAKEEHRKKHVLELAKSEKKGGAKTRIVHRHHSALSEDSDGEQLDGLDTDTRIIETDERSG